jgi:hypothetical protein
MEEGYIEAVEAEHRLMAIRMHDGASYCVVRLLGHYTPQVGQWVGGELHSFACGYITSDTGQTIAVSVVRAGCAQEEALRMLHDAR